MGSISQYTLFPETLEIITCLPVEVELSRIVVPLDSVPEVTLTSIVDFSLLMA